MNLFEQHQPLSEKVSIIIPGTVSVNVHVDTSYYVEDALAKLGSMFGGASAVQQQGSWISDQEGLVIENNTLVYAYTDELTDSALNELYAFAMYIADELDQEAVSVEVNNQLYFVEKSEEKKKIS